MKNKTGQQRLAVLIDADNASPQIVEPLFAEIAKYGVASVKRIYGDWTLPHLKGWKEVLLTYAIHPVQQFSYTKGKNSTDNAMIIDAMDLLYTNRFDGFCLVSSDSDFTRLASRLRESGLTVYGFGEQKTPNSLVSACDKFVYTEILKSGSDEGAEDEQAADVKPSRSGRMDTRDLKQDSRLMNLLRGAVDATADEDGWAHLASVGQQISNQSPSFDSRNYGYAKLGELVRAAAIFEIDERLAGGDPGRKDIYIRQKPRTSRRRRNGSAKKDQD